MSDLNKWYRIDDKTEERINSKGYRFVRPINHKTIPVSCPVCGDLFSTVEDIEKYKEIGCCLNCELMYYFTNKEKWKSGWRPNLINK